VAVAKRRRGDEKFPGEISIAAPAMARKGGGHGRRAMQSVAPGSGCAGKIEQR
jgi:hypothetical protein